MKGEKDTSTSIIIIKLLQKIKQLGRKSGYRLTIIEHPTTAEYLFFLKVQRSNTNGDHIMGHK